MKITKQNLLDILEDDFTYHADYHDISKSEIEDIIEEIDDDAEYKDFNEMQDDYRLFDKIIEYADSATPFCNTDLAQWFVGNYSAVDDYIREYGIDADNFDIMRTIAGAYCAAYEDALIDALRSLCEEVEALEDNK